MRTSSWPITEWSQLTEDPPWPQWHRQVGLDHIQWLKNQGLDRCQLVIEQRWDQQRLAVEFLDPSTEQLWICLWSRPGTISHEPPKADQCEQ